MVDTFALLVGTPLERGNNEEVINENVKPYLDANSVKYIPEGRFVSYNVMGQVDLATLSATQFGITGQMPYSECFTQYCQAIILKSINIAVEFDAGGGTKGDPVYVTTDGKATITAGAPDTSVGFLLEDVKANEYCDSRGNTIPFAGRIKYNKKWRKIMEQVIYYKNATYRIWLTLISQEGKKYEVQGSITCDKVIDVESPKPEIIQAIDTFKKHEYFSVEDLVFPKFYTSEIEDLEGTAFSFEVTAYMLEEAENDAMSHYDYVGGVGYD